MIPPVIADIVASVRMKFQRSTRDPLALVTRLRNRARFLFHACRQWERDQHDPEARSAGTRAPLNATLRKPRRAGTF